MSGLQIFNYKNHGVRTAEINGEVFFVARDVCDILGIDKHRDAVSRLRESQRGSVIVDTLGGRQEMTAINEAGLYKLAFTSRKEEAERFTDWVASEVLPSVRKHGAYMTPETIEKTLNDPDFIIGLATKLKEERAKRIEAEEQLQIAAPKAQFYDIVTGSKTTFDMANTAKILNFKCIGRNTLFEILRKCSVLRDDNTPYQKYVDMGWFRLVESKYTKPDGSAVVTCKTVVYQKGIDGIAKILSNLGFKRAS